MQHKEQVCTHVKPFLPFTKTHFAQPIMNSSSQHLSAELQTIEARRSTFRIQYKERPAVQTTPEKCMKSPTQQVSDTLTPLSMYCQI